MKSDRKDLLSQDRIVQGILSGLKIQSRPLFGRPLSKEESAKYFREQQEEIQKGLDLIPGQIQIRYVNSTDIERFNLDRFKYRQDVVPSLGDVLIEGESKGPFLFEDEFDIIYTTLLAIRLLKSGNVFLKNIYSFPKNSKSADGLILGITIPAPQKVWQFGYNVYVLYPNEKESLSNIIKELLSVDFEKESSFRIACDRFGKSYYSDKPEDQLLDICIGFEALYCKGERFQPMGSTIGLACSFLLGSNKKERDEIYQNIMSAFELRNDIVHGKEYEVNKIVEISSDFEKYLRSSILRLIPK